MTDESRHGPDSGWDPNDPADRWQPPTDPPIQEAVPIPTHDSAPNSIDSPHSDSPWQPPATPPGNQAVPLTSETPAFGEPPVDTESIRYPSTPAFGWQSPGPFADESVPPSVEDTLVVPVVPPPSPDAESSSGRPKGRVGGIVLGLALAAIVALAAFGLGRMTASDDDASTTTAAVATQVSVPTTLAPATDSTPPVATLPPAATDGVEPVAAAAAAVAPAVVQIETGSGTGSGVIYDADGYVLTAAHVVGNSSTVTVRLADGARIAGEVVGADSVTDVAVVSIDADRVPAIARLATGVDLAVGQTAVAVGSPFRLDQTVTAGIVSSVDRIVSSISMVQTDAAINPGNSGGPLVDSTGAVIGINDVIFTNSGGNEGVGFAISIDIAKIVADQITGGETVSLAYLGVGVDVPATGEAGALIQNVEPDTGAEASGLEVGDLVVAIDGDPVRDSQDLRAEIITREPGSEVTLSVIRDGVEIAIVAELGTIATN